MSNAAMAPKTFSRQLSDASKVSARRSNPYAPPCAYDGSSLSQKEVEPLLLLLLPLRLVMFAAKARHCQLRRKQFRPVQKRVFDAMRFEPK